MRKSTYLMAGLLGLGCLLSLPASAGQVYKWTDENGQTHYSENPPPSSAKQSSTLQVKTKLPEGTAEAMEARNKALAEREKAAKDKAKAAAANTPAGAKAQNAERCQQLKNNLKTLTDYGRVRISDEKGENRVMSDEEKQQKMAETQKQIKEDCAS